eukprot:4008509-Alexandrium_andersonii.AAC.1
MSAAALVRKQAQFLVHARLPLPTRSLAKSVSRPSVHGTCVARKQDFASACQAPVSEPMFQQFRCIAQGFGRGLSQAVPS